MTMTALVADRYGSPEVLRVEELPKPAPRTDEILVRVCASSINTADIDNLRGRPLPLRLYTGLRRPRREIPGFDIAGVAYPANHVCVRPSVFAMQAQTLAPRLFLKPGTSVTHPSAGIALPVVRARTRVVRQRSARFLSRPARALPALPRGDPARLHQRCRLGRIGRRTRRPARAAIG